MSSEFIEQIGKVEKVPVTIREALVRGVAKDDEGMPLIMPDYSSLEQAMEERKLTLYLGIDPTSPELHIGHTVPLRKLRHFQDLGHNVNLLFGTFTGMIGDPTDKSAARVRLTREQIDTNIADYKDQAAKILDLSPDAKNPIKIVHNDEWLAPINFEGVLDLASNVTVQQMLQRQMFKERIEAGKPVSLTEFLYPILQGFDSVAMKVDLEVGGKDQVFNMLVGRDFVKSYLNKEKWVLATRLIEDPNGKKMGKTEGNIVNIRDYPEIIYEGIMTWPDSTIQMGFELITSIPLEQVYIIGEKLANGELDPMVTKEALAHRVTQELHGADAANYAREEFQRVKREGKLPRRIKEVSIEKGAKISDVLLLSGLCKTPEEAIAKVAQRAIFIDGQQPQKDIVWPDSASTIQIGKKTIKNVRSVVLR